MQFLIKTMRGMKKVMMALTVLLSFSFSYSQSNEKEYVGIGAEFQGILNLTITSESQIDFVFKSINDYKNGIVKRNAVKLEVDATMAWDLFAYANTDNWTQTDNYSESGEAVLPAEVLEIQSSNPNQCDPVGGNFNTFHSIKGLTNSGVLGGLPDPSSTQFVAGMAGMGDGKSYKPGSAKDNSETNQFSLDYRIVPGELSNFPNSTLSIPGTGSLQSGAYYLEVVYCLVEDL